MKIYISIIKNGDDSGEIIQYAKSIEQARNLIENVLPKAKSGYSYRIDTK